MRAASLGANVIGVETLETAFGKRRELWRAEGNLYSYDVTLQDAAVAAGQQFKVDASGLGAGENFGLNGSAETDGAVRLWRPGNGHADRRRPHDIFFFGDEGRWGDGDTVDGGAGATPDAARRLCRR